MRTSIKWGIALAIIVVITGLILWVLPAPMVAFFASKSLGTPVEIAQFRPGWSSMSFQGLKVFGADGKKQDPALTIKTGDVKASMWSVATSKDLTIPSITLSDIHMLLDFSQGMSLSKSNWRMLATQPEAAPVDKASDTKVLIERLLLEEIHVDIIYPGGTKSSLKPIKRVELKNIASAEAAGAQISNLIIGAILRQTLSLENLLSKLTDAAILPVDFVVKDGIEQIPDLFKGIFGGGSAAETAPAASQ